MRRLVTAHYYRQSTHPFPANEADFNAARVSLEGDHRCDAGFHGINSLNSEIGPPDILAKLQPRSANAVATICEISGRHCGRPRPTEQSIEIGRLVVGISSGSIATRANFKAGSMTEVGQTWRRAQHRLFSERQRIKCRSTPPAADLTGHLHRRGVRLDSIRHKKTSHRASPSSHRAPFIALRVCTAYLQLRRG